MSNLYDDEECEVRNASNVCDNAREEYEVRNVSNLYDNAREEYEVRNVSNLYDNPTEEYEVRNVSNLYDNAREEYEVRNVSNWYDNEYEVRNMSYLYDNVREELSLTQNVSLHVSKPRVSHCPAKKKSFKFASMSKVTQFIQCPRLPNFSPTSFLALLAIPLHR